jgi:hypothetical protein
MDFKLTFYKIKINKYYIIFQIVIHLFMNYLNTKTRVVKKRFFTRFLVCNLNKLNNKVIHIF